MSNSANKDLDVSFEKNEFSLVSNSLINTKEYNKVIQDFEFDESTYKNMVTSLEKLVLSQEKQYESKITVLNQTIESLQMEVMNLNELVAQKDREITVLQASKDFDNDPSMNYRSLLNRSALSENPRAFDREWSDIKQREHSLYCYVKKKVDTNLAKKRESMVRKHGYAKVTKKEDTSIINTISKPKKESTLYRLNQSENSDWETRWERKWISNEFKEVEESRNLLKELENAYTQGSVSAPMKKDVIPSNGKIDIDVSGMKNEIMDFENMIVNLNKNYDILEKKIDRLVKQRNELKIINTNFTINIRNSQKIIREYESMLKTSASYTKECTDVNYNLTGLFEKLININSSSRDFVVAIAEYLQRNRLEPGINKMNVILMALRDNFKNLKDKNGKLFLKKTPSVKFSPRFPTPDNDANKENININNEEIEKSSKNSQKNSKEPENSPFMNKKIRSFSELRHSSNEEFTERSQGKPILIEDFSEKHHHHHLKYEDLETKYLELIDEKFKLEKEIDFLKKGQEKDENKIKRSFEFKGNGNFFKKSQDLLNFIEKIDEKNSKSHDFSEKSKILISNSEEERLENFEEKFKISQRQYTEIEKLMETMKEKFEKNTLELNNKSLSLSEECQNLKKKLNEIQFEKDNLEKNNREKTTENQVKEKKIQEYLQKISSLEEKSKSFGEKNKKIQVLNEEIEKMQRKMTEIQEENLRTGKELKEKRMENEIKTKKIQKLEENIETLEKKIKKIQNELQDAKEKNRQVLDENYKVKLKLTEIQEENNKFRKNLIEKQNEIELKNKQIQAQVEKIENFEIKMTEMTKIKKANKITNKSQQYLGQISNLEKKCDVYRNDIEKLEIDNKNLNLSINNLKEEIVDLNNEKSIQNCQYCKNIVQIQNELEENRRIIDDIKRNCKDINDKCLGLERELNETNLIKAEALQDFEKKNQNLVGELGKEIQKNIELTEHHEILANKLKENDQNEFIFESKIKTLEVKLESILKECSSMQVKNCVLIEENTQLHKEKENLDKVLKNMESEFHTIRKKILFYMQEKKLETNAKNEIKVISQEENSKLENLIETLASMSNGIEGKLQNFIEENSKLQHDISELKKDKELAQKDLENLEKKYHDLVKVNDETERKLRGELEEYMNLKKKYTDILEKNLKVEKENENLRNEKTKIIESFRQENDKQILEKKATDIDLISLKAKIEKIRTENLDLERNYKLILEENSNTIKKLESNNIKIIQDNTSLKAELDNMYCDFKSLEQKYNELQLENSILLQNLSEIKEATISFQLNEEKLKNIIDSQNKSFSSLEQKCHSLSKENQRLEDESKQILSSYEEVSMNYSHLEVKLSKLQERNSQLEQESKRILSSYEEVSNNFSLFKYSKQQEDSKIFKEGDFSKSVNNSNNLETSGTENNSFEKMYKELFEKYQELEKEAEVLKNAQELLLNLLKNKDDKIEGFERRNKELMGQKNILEEKLEIESKHIQEMKEDLNEKDEKLVIYIAKIKEMEEKCEEFEKTQEKLQKQRENNKENMNLTQFNIFNQENSQKTPSNRIKVPFFKGNTSFPGFEIIKGKIFETTEINDDDNLDELDRTMKKIKKDHTSSKHRIKNYFENMLLNIFNYFSKFFENIMKNPHLDDISTTALEQFIGERKIGKDLQEKFKEMVQMVNKFKGGLKAIGKKESEIWRKKIEGNKGIVDNINILAEEYQNYRSELLKNILNA